MRDLTKFYCLKHTNSTYLSSASYKLFYSNNLSNKIRIEEMFDLLNPVEQHLSVETAEQVRSIFPRYRWLHLTGLLTKFGTILRHRPFFGYTPRWISTGESYPVGCRFRKEIIYSSFFENNPDREDSRYNSDLGIYSKGCGFNNVMMNFSCDEFLNSILRSNPHSLPEASLYLLRFQNFSSWYYQGAYSELSNSYDQAAVPVLLTFVDSIRYCTDKVDRIRLPNYYLELCREFFPEPINL